MNSLSNMNVLVTGAGSGLGAAIAKRLINGGARVALLDIRSENAERVIRDIDPERRSTLALACDVADQAQVADGVALLRERWGYVDALVNNAGTDVTASIDEVDVSAWTKVIETNLIGPFLLTKAVLPLLRSADQGRGGHIINVASTASLRAWPNASAYHASKWGLLGMSKALHAELRPQGVRVTSLIAGGMRTPFLLDRFPGIDTSTLQEPANVAEAVQFVLTMPRGTVIAEIMVLPDAETSWP